VAAAETMHQDDGLRANTLFSGIERWGHESGRVLIICYCRTRDIECG
jgi:hypothetical protein